MSKITVKFITLGCKTNLYESEAMAALFRQHGYTVAADNAPADVCVINTCTVTGTGAQKSRQQIRRAIRENPNAVIAVAGCFAQTEPDRVRAIEGVDVLIGNKYKNEIVQLVEQARCGKRTDRIVDIRAEHEYEELAASGWQSRVRANLKIQDGCSNFCAYCIIPYARGPVRSRRLEDILQEAQALAASGYAEVVLTGIHIDSYGQDLAEDLSLIDVIEAVHTVPGLARIRLGSLEPAQMTEAFVQRAARLEKLCPQFHLSLQSGCDATLKRMSRRYTTDGYARAVALLRAALPDAAITTDLMVGFPGETEAEFQTSYDFCAQIGFSQMHIFPYSPRRGTRAAEMPGQIPKAVKEERAGRMLALADSMRGHFYRSYLGRSVQVLVEQQREDGLCHATTANYMDVLVPCAPEQAGQMLTVRLAGMRDGCLLGVQG